MAIRKYKYRAINAKGRPIRGMISANGEVDLHAQLQTAGLELVQFSEVKTGGKTGMFGGAKVKTRDLMQLFTHLRQMQDAGVPLLDALGDIRDSTENQALRDIMSEITRSVSEGSSFSESLANHPKVFTNLYISLVSAGEETGDLSMAYRQLVKYLIWVDDMQSKIKKATRYPMILGVVVLLVIYVMMAKVVPQVVGFLDNVGQELPMITISLQNTSAFFVDYGLFVLLAPIVIFIVLKMLRKNSEDFKYKTDYMLLGFPIVGNLIRKISIARYAQTFGALFAAGVDVVSCLESSKNTVSNLALLEGMDAVTTNVKNGSSVSEAFNTSGEFPSLVVRMVKIGEESGGMTEVLNQVADFYTKDVNEAVDGMITMVEPMLTAILGGMILWIAAGVFGPIYGMLGTAGA